MSNETLIQKLFEKGVREPIAGQHLRMALIRLENQTSVAKAAFVTLGVNVFGAGGSVRPLENILRDLKAAFDHQNIADQERIQMVKAIFGAEALASILTLINAA